LVKVFNGKRGAGKLNKNMIAYVEKILIQDLKNALYNVSNKQGLEIEIPAIDVEVPREKSHGDYASNIAMKLAGKFHKSPRDIATLICESFNSEIVDSVDIAGPGFINFTLDRTWLYETLDIIMQEGSHYGQTDYGNKQKVQIEFVSANPTGPLHVGHSRGAVVGDVLASIMEAAGYNVEREYYINNAGNQMNILGKSTLIRYKQLLGHDINLPENAYRGEYIVDISREIKNKYGNKILENSEEEQLDFCRDFAYKKMLAIIKDDLADYGIEFDYWFSERDLHKGKVKEAIALLRDKGFIYEKDDALWFKATDFNDRKDRVVIKSDGEPTYLAADIAYHLDKMKRGYEHLINIWGADHHGYISRVRAAIQAFGYSGDQLEIVLIQLVTLLRDGKKVPMSKREGNFVTMRDVLEEVGKDAARYFYIMRSTDSHFDFDLDLAKEESTNNPVYYIQYAHARICSIFANIEDFNFEDNIDLNLLTTAEEVELMKLLARYPEEIRISAVNKQPHNMASFAYDLANAFHVFYNKCRVITGDDKLTSARVYLVKATQQVLQNVLSLLGLNAPEQM